MQACILATAATLSPLMVMDVGANEGEWTISVLNKLSKDQFRGTKICLHAFEPVPSTVARLRSSIADHQFGSIAQVQQEAVSDQAGDARIAVMSETGGTNTIHPGNAIECPIQDWLDVRTTTLDAFCELHGITHVHLAKSDTEGHDLIVLRGARGLLAAERIDAFQFEYNHRWVFSRAFLRDVFDLVAGLPYVVTRIMPAHIEVLPNWHPELERFFEANYLLVRKPALDWFDVRHGAFDSSNTYA